MSSEFIEFDLVIRIGVDMQASPQVVWDQLDRIQEWKNSVVSLERIAGAPNEVGEVLRIGQRPGDQTVYVIQTTLGIRRSAWRAGSLITEDGHTTSGYVVYSLYARGSQTLVVCDLLARGRLPAGAILGATVEQGSREICDGTQAKLDADHRMLKKLIERGRRPRLS